MTRVHTVTITRRKQASSGDGSAPPTCPPGGAGCARRRNFMMTSPIGDGFAHPADHTELSWYMLEVVD